MIDELEGADDDDEEEAVEGLGLEIDSRTQIFLEMRQQNLDLLKVRRLVSAVPSAVSLAVGRSSRRANAAPGRTTQAEPGAA